VVVGGLGSLLGAFVVSLLLGVLQTAAVGVDAALGALPGGAWLPAALQATTVAQWAPLLPFAVMVVVLVARPRGLMGRRDA
jgi:branched-chain amino acid transport system permease protein